MRRALPFLLIFSLAISAPSIQAHASPDPLEVEVQLLDDDIDDAYAQYDGFDIQDLYVREASFSTNGPGLVFRVYLYGGFANPAVASSLPLEVDITAAGSTHTLSAETSDGTNWTGNSIIEQEFEEEDGLSEGYLQLFMPLSTLDVNLGDEVGPFVVRTYADGDLRDIAPGGRPVPGTQGQTIVPADDVTVQDSLIITGPIGYTETTLSISSDEVKASVQNLIVAVGQHISIDINAPEGWTIVEPSPVIIITEPGQNPAFLFTATAKEGSIDATITIRTDLGGEEIMLLRADQVPAADATSTTPDVDDDFDDQATPFPFLMLIIGLLAVALVVRRRQN